LGSSYLSLIPKFRNVETVGRDNKPRRLLKAVDNGNIEITLPHDIVIGVEVPVLCRGAKEEPISLWFTDYLKVLPPTVSGRFIGSAATFLVGIVASAIQAEQELASILRSIGDLESEASTFRSEQFAVRTQRFGSAAS
jgi:hypothetical protein